MQLKVRIIYHKELAMISNNNVSTENEVVTGEYHYNITPSDQSSGQACWISHIVILIDTAC